ncbi:hypothetical protein SUNI508_11150 [Seiridium unicorne]|uniref:Biogenesis of lysosome-related organelles complex 1 subunit 1 n=1 Tax=Seiridium unicorne TaxID=138068 RepID=A0ABR2UIX9_9PEZI
MSAGPSTGPVPGPSSSLTQSEADPLGSSSTASGNLDPTPSSSTINASSASSSHETSNAALSSPSFPPSSSSRQGPPQLSPRTPTTASTSVSTNQVLHPNLPSPSSHEQTAQARAALVGTISNLLDVELQGRASLLHSNAKALEVQERDVAKATEALRKENDKLIKVVKEGSKKVLETGNVQNWAEVLERDFLVLEDTLRQVRRGSGGGCSDPDCSGCSCGTGSWSGSRTPSRHGSMFGGDGVATGQGKDGKGKAVEEFMISEDGDAIADGGMDIDGQVASKLDGQESTFALVDNAIAASISEAMATSINDFFVPPSAPEPEPEPESEPAWEKSVTFDDLLDKGKSTEHLNDVPENSSSAMELDDDPPKVQVAVPNHLDDREIEALEAIGLSPEAEHGGGKPPADTGLEGGAAASSTDVTQRETPKPDESIANEDRMDIDAPDEAAHPRGEPTHVTDTAQEESSNGKEDVVPQPGTT